MFQFPPVTVALVLTTIVSGAGAVLLYRNVVDPEADRLTANHAQLLVLVMLTIWSAGQAVAVVTEPPLVKLAGIYLTASATLWTCVAWFLFVFMYTGRREWVTRRRLVLLSILPLLGTVGFATNSYTGLFLVDPTPKHVNGRAVLSFRWGIGTWLSAIHCWIISGIGFYVLLGKFRSSRNIYRKISFLHLVGALVLCGGPFFSFVGWSPFRYMVLSVVGILGIVLVSTAATISRRTLHVLPLERILSTLAGRWKDLTPMARDAVIQTMRTGVIVLDGENRIVDVNPIGKRMIGAVDRRVVGQTLTDIIPTDVFQVEDTSFLDPETTEGTFRGVWVETPDVEQYCFDIQVTSLGESDDAVGRTILVTDVTERENRKEKLETRTQELQRQNDQLEEFAGIVSHDLRNPLNVARGYLQVAKETDDVEPIEEADQSLDRMEMIIEDVLTLARQGQSIGETESVELEAIARDAWEHVDNGAADLEVTGSGVMNADPTRLLNLFENLYRNAIEHAGPGVSMTVGRDQDGFFVADDGQGIPEANQEEIFESGYTTEETGTGFGLAIVSQIAEAHGWSVGITDSETGGARFEFRGVEYSLDDGESTPGRSMIS